MFRVSKQVHLSLWLKKPSVFEIPPCVHIHIIYIYMFCLFLKIWNHFLTVLILRKLLLSVPKPYTTSKRKKKRKPKQNLLVCVPSMFYVCLLKVSVALTSPLPSRKEKKKKKRKEGKAEQKRTLEGRKICCYLLPVSHWEEGRRKRNLRLTCRFLVKYNRLNKQLCCGYPRVRGT